MFRLSRAKAARSGRPNRGGRKLKRRAGLNASHVKSLRYGGGASADTIAVAVCRQIVSFLTDGRVPLDVGIKAMEMAESEIQDRMSDESLTWVESQRPWHGGDRNRGDEE